MVLACGLLNFDLSFFHLINHAFFKALLFLSAGVIIHSFFNQQDLRFMGGFLPFFPFLYSLFLIGSFSLSGFPFLTGFYSKDLILEFGFSKFTFSSYFVFWLALLTVSLTSFYSFRLLFFLFFNKPFSLSLNAYSNIHPANFFALFPLALLSLFSIFFGYFFKDLFVGFGSSFLSFQQLDIDSELLPLHFKLLPLIFSFFGLFTSFLFYFHFFPAPFINPIYNFFANKWYVDLFYNRLAYSVLIFSYLIPLKSFDRGFLEFYQSLNSSLLNSGEFWKKIHTGDIYHYSFFFFLSLLLLFFLFSFFPSPFFSSFFPPFFFFAFTFFLFFQSFLYFFYNRTTRSRPISIFQPEIGGMGRKIIYNNLTAEAYWLLPLANKIRPIDYVNFQWYIAVYPFARCQFIINLQPIRPVN